MFNPLDPTTWPPVENFNPNHDETGRFSSGDGAGSGGGLSSAEEQFAQEVQVAKSGYIDKKKLAAWEPFKKKEAPPSKKDTRRLNIDHVESMLASKGHRLVFKESPGYDLATKTTSYMVEIGGTKRLMTTDEIRALIKDVPKPKLKS